MVNYLDTFSDEKLPCIGRTYTVIMQCNVDNNHGESLGISKGDTITIKKIENGFVYFSADTECTEEIECEYYKELDSFWQYFGTEELMGDTIHNNLSMIL